MAIVFACIAPHGGHLLGPDETSPVPQCRAAMTELARLFRDARPDSIAILTPHGVMVEGRMSLGVTPYGYGELDDLTMQVETDLDLASLWAYKATERGIPVAPLADKTPDIPLPLDWGVTIPLALLLPPGEMLPTVVACPARDLTRPQLIDWGEALVAASDELGRRVALVVSADQGHGHAEDGPYGFTPVSAQYDQAMQEVIQSGDLTRLLEWPEEFAENALADSYWQTLCLIGVGKRVPLRPRLLAYEVDHYFGLLCAAFLP